MYKCISAGLADGLFLCLYGFFAKTQNQKPRRRHALTFQLMTFVCNCCYYDFFILLISFFKVPAGHTIICWVSHFLQTTFNGVSRCFLLGLSQVPRMWQEGLRRLLVRPKTNRTGPFRLSWVNAGDKVYF